MQLGKARKRYNPIVGMSKPSRIVDNLQALHIDFTAEELAQLNVTFALDASYLLAVAAALHLKTKERMP